MAGTRKKTTSRIVTIHNGVDPESGSDFLRGEIDYAMNAFDGMDPYMSAYALMGMRIALGLVPDFVPNLPWRT
ncbi:MAG: hypothetical protein EBT64_06760 [Gammaproteobacteria bacterium]|nr:hypothetical protein [Gammaproteobacteria bacterium]